ncbi:glycosyltransferase family 2 protein [Pontibacter sp. FD36]|uniref:glycosyltransferase family 2 protein n=1 Tax=Pontibacter sp. FD36 TaxID=2789860 RepID=UPI0018AA42E7|nr:glycosyltransferase family 2 protein [Pontibacter sp. FD36]MBF8964221.1 glycosyltransferase family 2 protein [Pontibacter sp. FD36]
MISNIVVSVIIPHYNRIELIEETIKSLSNQTYRNWECLIIDDGSTGQTLDKIGSIIKDDERISLYSRPEHFIKGANSCRRYGLTLSKGKYIKWFDSDDLMEENLLEKQVMALEKGYDGVLCNCSIYNENFSVIIKHGWRKKIYDSNYLKEYLRGQLAWQTGTGLWSKDLCEKLKPFSQNLKNAQEWLFHFTILCSPAKIAIINSSLVRIRAHEDSISYKSRDAEYFYNRILARIMALDILITSGNRGKRYLIKTISRQLFIYIKTFEGAYFMKTLFQALTHSIFRLKLHKVNVRPPVLAKLELIN